MSGTTGGSGGSNTGTDTTGGGGDPVTHRGSIPPKPPTQPAPEPTKD